MDQCEDIYKNTHIVPIHVSARYKDIYKDLCKDTYLKSMVSPLFFLVQIPSRATFDTSLVHLDWQSNCLKSEFKIILHARARTHTHTQTQMSRKQDQRACGKEKRMYAHLVFSS